MAVHRSQDDVFRRSRRRRWTETSRKPCGILCAIINCNRKTVIKPNQMQSKKRTRETYPWGSYRICRTHNNIPSSLVCSFSASGLYSAWRGPLHPRRQAHARKIRIKKYPRPRVKIKSLAYLLLSGMFDRCRCDVSYFTIICSPQWGRYLIPGRLAWCTRLDHSETPRNSTTLTFIML